MNPLIFLGVLCVFIVFFTYILHTVKISQDAQIGILVSLFVFIVPVMMLASEHIDSANFNISKTTVYLDALDKEASYNNNQLKNYNLLLKNNMGEKIKPFAYEDSVYLAGLSSGDIAMLTQDGGNSINQTYANLRLLRAETESLSDQNTGTLSTFINSTAANSTESVLSISNKTTVANAHSAMLSLDIVIAAYFAPLVASLLITLNRRRITSMLSHVVSRLKRRD